MCLSYIVVLNILYIYFLGTYRQGDTDQGSRPTTVCEAAYTIEATVHIMITIFFNDTEIYVIILLYMSIYHFFCWV